MRRLIANGMAALALGLAISLPATAKEPTLPAPSAVPASEKKAANDHDRLIAITIELAWLADPITFPYYLDARMEGSVLHVHGIVPNLAVRDQAIKLARLRCPMMVSDDTVVRSEQVVAFVRIPAGQLEKAGKAALHATLPDASRRFQVSADSAGRIKVMGQVHSFEERLAVSQELHRVYGCTAVANLVHVVEAAQVAPGRNTISKPDMEASSAMGPLKPNQPKSPAIVNNPPITQPSRTFWEKLGFARESVPAVLDAKNGPALPEAQSSLTTVREEAKTEVETVKVASATEESQESSPPLVTHGTVMITEEPAPPAPAIQLRNHVIASCGIPGQSLQVEFKSATDLEIRIVANNQDEANTLAQRVFQLPELLPYHVDVKVTIPR